MKLNIGCYPKLGGAVGVRRFIFPLTQLFKSNVNMKIKAVDRLACVFSNFVLCQ
jgi:hypothetical protein